MASEVQQKEGDGSLLRVRERPRAISESGSSIFNQLRRHFRVALGREAGAEVGVRADVTDDDV
jgi:hypothetical protein